MDYQVKPCHFVTLLILVKMLLLCAWLCERKINVELFTFLDSPDFGHSCHVCSWLTCSSSLFSHDLKEFELVLSVQRLP